MLSGAAEETKRILVACHEIAVAGGLYRFERFGRIIQKSGSLLSFVAFSETPQRVRRTDFPVLSFEDAARETWDITMVPGAGFPERTIRRFAEFISPCFGLRVQHILNDQTRKHSFLEVNRAFEPDIVVVNNRHWLPTDLSDFRAEALYFLEGAVDAEGLAGAPRRYDGSRSGPFVVGGLANKNVEPLVEAVRICGRGVRLHLLGQAGDLAERKRELVGDGILLLSGVLRECELPHFYAGLDCVVHTETFAGWANVAAEGMASGVPVICTPHGTLAFAEHETTALVVSDPMPAALAEAIQRLRDDPDLANRLACNAQQWIQRFSWTSYSSDLLRLMRLPRVT